MALPFRNIQAISIPALCGLFLLITLQTHSQKAAFVHDSNYYKTYPKQLTGRIYFSKKYTALLLEAPDDQRSLKYLPNTPVTIGVGATYHILSLNIGFGLRFLNPNRDLKGKTNYIDLQSHVYAPKWVIDLFGQFYNGYYLSPRGYVAPASDKFYLRPDIKVNLVGASVYRLVNGERLSYRAAFLQNEWQKKSAGSFLFGGEIYTGVIKGDSALIPSELSSTYSQRGVYKNKFLEVGPGIGYAYTAVLKEHFFATGSITLTGDVSFVSEYSLAGNQTRTTVSPNASLRAVVGYNSDRWIFSVSWVNTNTNLKGKSSNDQYLIRTGNFRLNVAKRFKPGNKLKKRLKIVDTLPLTNSQQNN